MAIGIALGALFSLLTSWFVAHRYFKRQRKIDKEKERKEVELSHAKLMGAYFRMYGKQPKSPSPYLRDAMAEFEMKVKVYRPEFDAQQMMRQTGIDAEKFIRDNPDSFEDIQAHAP